MLLHLSVLLHQYMWAFGWWRSVGIFSKTHRRRFPRCLAPSLLLKSRWGKSHLRKLKASVEPRKVKGKPPHIIAKISGWQLPTLHTWTSIVSLKSKWWKAMVESKTSTWKKTIFTRHNFCGIKMYLWKKPQGYDELSDFTQVIKNIQVVHCSPVKD